jgi:glutamine synthetase
LIEHADRPCDRESIERIVRSGEIRTVRMMLPDMHGVARAKMVTAGHFLEVIDSGHSWGIPLIMADLWQNVPSDREVPTGNATIWPDLSTFARLPWAPHVAHVICDVALPGGGVATARDVLRRVLESAATSGFEPLFGNELEFYVYEPIGDGPKLPVVGMSEWFTDQALAKRQPFLDDLFAFLPLLGVPVYEIFNEHGAGQLEINLSPSTGVSALDWVFIAKAAIKEVARLHGLHATFMPVPRNDTETPPSGYHLHQTLLGDDGVNLFVPKHGDAALSEVGLSYVAGQLEHAPALTGLVAQTVTAYKRYRPGTWAPMRAGWGIDNRTAMVRALPRGVGTHIENRLGSSCANPYLLAAAEVAAGLDGVARRLDPGQPCAGNVADDQRYPSVPLSLWEGLQAVQADNVLCVALDAEFVAMYHGVMLLTWRRFQSYVTDWEFSEYREVL